MRKNIKYQISKIKNRRKKAFLALVGVVIVFLLVLPSRQTSQKPSYTSPSPIPQLTEDEKFMLNPPAANASSSAKEKHKIIVASLAKESETIDIKNCKPNPLVVKTKLGSEIKIINKDNEKRRIIIDSKNIFKIAPGEEKMVNTKFKYGTGDYGYVCEGSGIVGFLHVVE